MCGVVGIASPERAIDASQLHRATAALVSRGPDGEGHWLADGGLAALGHRRLGTVDVLGGRQPLATEDGVVRAVVNGEFYGAEALRRRLEATGHRFATHVDSELLVHLYEDHGVDLFTHLRGEFAFILWDDKERRLFAARDRFGVKPLCFSEHEGVLYVASQAKALFAAGVPAAWDHASVYQAASMQYALPGSTLFRNVRELPAGHWLLWHRGALRIERYWDMDYPPEASYGAEPPDAARTFRSLFESAVRSRVVADVPVAFQLSGGIDSSAVAAVAAREHPSAIHCFTVGFDDAQYDELSLASAMAKHLNAEHHIVRVTEGDVADELPQAVVAGEGLAINGHIAAKFMLSRAVRDAGFKVVLTGEGADEVLAGYAHLRRDLDADQQTLLRTNAISRGLMLPDGEPLLLDQVKGRLGFVPTWLLAKATLGRRVHQILSPRWLTELAPGDPFETFVNAIDVDGQLRGRGRVEQSLYLWTKFALEGYILRTLGDGMEMAHSVEGRLPFLDHELFEWLRTIPTSSRIRDGVEKAILRRAMEGLLPESVCRREKHPFLAPPFFATSRSPLAQLLADLLASDVGRALPFFDVGKVHGLIAALDTMTPEGRIVANPILFMVLSACLLGRHFRL